MPNKQGNTLINFSFFSPTPRSLLALCHKSVKTTEICSVYMSSILSLETEIAFFIDEYNVMSGMFFGPLSHCTWIAWPSAVIPSLENIFCYTLKRLPFLFLEFPTPPFILTPSPFIWLLRVDVVCFKSMEVIKQPSQPRAQFKIVIKRKCCLQWYSNLKTLVYIYTRATLFAAEL